MRFFAAILLLLAFVGTVSAEDWQQYRNTRFGFVVDVPPGFSGGALTDNTEGQTFASADGTQRLTFGGGSVQPGSFNTQWKRTQAAYTEGGWALTYKPVAPNWTVFIGERNDRDLYVKMLPLCGGTKQFAMFAVEYPKDDAADLAPTLERMAASFKHLDTGFSC
jgi:hypothetical protein